MKKFTAIAASIVILSFVITIFLYPMLPSKIASHWDMEGNVNGYMEKEYIFLIPCIIFLLLLLFIAIPKIDPLAANIEKFRKYYYGFVIIFLIFMLLVQLQILLWNIGVKVGINAIFPAIAVIYIYVGFLLEKAKRNWFIGIRTPWTLSSDNVWEKTHKIGGKLFKIAGIIAIFSVIFQKYAIYFVVIPIFAVATYTIIYSYFEYQKEIH